ncbi:MAG: DUF120 domain-containing protein [Candidatus Bathyarchaeia archaeon]
MKTLSVKGRVFSGLGKGSEFLKLPWVRRQIEEKLGFKPYPGTLNIKIDGPLSLRDNPEQADWIEITPEPGYCRGKCVKCYIDEIECAIILPEIAGYPSDIIEVIAPINLRERLGLRDGDVLTVVIPLKR